MQRVWHLWLPELVGIRPTVKWCFCSFWPWQRLKSP